jgi:hypothetical protein
MFAAVALMVAAPALAGDGNVPKSSLASLGLGQMAVQSDAFGMQVRGMSSNARSTTASAGAIFLFDPNTGSQFNFNGNSGALSTAENAGLNVVSNSLAVSTTTQSAQNIAITFNGVTFNAIFAAFTINGTAVGTGL